MRHAGSIADPGRRALHGARRPTVDLAIPPALFPTIIRGQDAAGLTSNPTIFEHAIGAGDSYDASIRVLAHTGLSDEDLFFEAVGQHWHQRPGGT